MTMLIVMIYVMLIVRHMSLALQMLCVWYELFLYVNMMLVLVLIVVADR